MARLTSMASAPGRDMAAEEKLYRAYHWLNRELAGRDWANGAEFTMADRAAAPALFYADWVLPIDSDHSDLRNYRTRLLAHPSVARTVDEARPYRRLLRLVRPIATRRRLPPAGRP